VGSYIIRDIDPALWPAVKAKAALSKTSIKALIEKLLRDWLKEGIV
jgi:hypothetical protein